MIELREFAAPGVTALLEGRLRASHRLRIIEGQDPAPLRQDRGLWLVARPRVRTK